MRQRAIGGFLFVSMRDASINKSLCVSVPLPVLPAVGHYVL